MKYNKFIFDCDGVILNSNQIKKDAFQQILSQFEDNLVNIYNQSPVSKNGYSRHQKFAYFCNTILRLKGEDYELKLSKLLENYSNLVVSQLINCEIPSSLKSEFYNLFNLDQVFVVSAGDEKELKHVFKEIGLNNFVKEKHIFGSPKSKIENISNLYLDSKILNTDKVLLIGDASYDYDVACKFNFDFLFVSDWTGDPAFSSFVLKNKIDNISNLNFLKNYLINI